MIRNISASVVFFSFSFPAYTSTSLALFWTQLKDWTTTETVNRMQDKPKGEWVKLLAKLGQDSDIQIQKRGGVSTAGEKEQFKLIPVYYQHSLRYFIQKGRI